MDKFNNIKEHSDKVKKIIITKEEIDNAIKKLPKKLICFTMENRFFLLVFLKELLSLWLICAVK